MVPEATIVRNSAATSDAPPTRKPSTSGCDASSLLFEPLTEPTRAYQMNQPYTNNPQSLLAAIIKLSAGSEVVERVVPP